MELRHLRYFVAVAEELNFTKAAAGLWHDTDFYTAFETSYRAVFVRSMYLAFGPDAYIRYGFDDPWAAEWIVQQARDHRINGALVLRPRSMKPAGTGRLFIERALEESGIPVLPVEGDVVDARTWDGAAARAAVRSFLETRVVQSLSGVRRDEGDRL